MHCRACQTESERSVGSVGGNVQLFKVQSHKSRLDLQENCYDAYVHANG